MSCTHQHNNHRIHQNRQTDRVKATPDRAPLETLVSTSILISEFSSEFYFWVLPRVPLRILFWISFYVLYHTLATDAVYKYGNHKLPRTLSRELKQIRGVNREKWPLNWSEIACLTTNSVNSGRGVYYRSIVSCVCASLFTALFTGARQMIRPVSSHLLSMLDTLHFPVVSGVLAVPGVRCPFPNCDQNQVLFR